MDNESFKKGLGKAFDNTEKPKLFGNWMEEAKDVKRNDIDRQSVIPSVPQNSLIFSSEIQDSINELADENARKAREKEQREIAQTQYLKNISENTDYIAKEFKTTSIALITLNNIMARAEVTFSDIQKDVEESKAINAEIFKILAKTHISNEQERLKATESLLTKIQDKAVLAEVPANIMSLIDFIWQFQK